MKSAMRAASIASAQEPVVPSVPAVDLTPTGHLPFVVQAAEATAEAAARRSADRYIAEQHPLVAALLAGEPTDSDEVIAVFDDTTDVSVKLLLAGLDEAATATTPKARANGELTALVGHAMKTVRALVAQHQADGREDIAHALGDDIAFGALREVLDDAVRNVLRELTDQGGSPE